EAIHCELLTTVSCSTHVVRKSRWASAVEKIVISNLGRSA
ncbi:hypothetical protein GCK32_017125, partial [Trichostrongylus colubriformis]